MLQLGDVFTDNSTTPATLTSATAAQAVVPPAVSLSLQSAPIAHEMAPASAVPETVATLGAGITASTPVSPLHVPSLAGVAASTTAPALAAAPVAVRTSTQSTAEVELAGPPGSGVSAPSVVTGEVTQHSPPQSEMMDVDKVDNSANQQAPLREDNTTVPDSPARDPPAPPTASHANQMQANCDTNEQTKSSGNVS